MRKPDYDADIRRLLDAGFTFIEIWVLQPDEEAPEDAHTTEIDGGLRIAFRHSKEVDNGTQDSSDGVREVA